MHSAYLFREYLFEAIMSDGSAHDQNDLTSIEDSPCMIRCRYLFEAVMNFGPRILYTTVSHLRACVMPSRTTASACRMSHSRPAGRRPTSLDDRDLLAFEYFLDSASDRSRQRAASDIKLVCMTSVRGAKEIDAHGTRHTSIPRAACRNVHTPSPMRWNGEFLDVNTERAS